MKTGLLKQAAQSYVQLGFEYDQSCGFYNISGKPVPVLLGKAQVWPFSPAAV